MKIKITLITFLILLLFSCKNDDDCIEGDGNTTTKSFNLADFDSFFTDGSWEVNLVYGTTSSVSATGDANVIERLNLTVSNGQLNIDLEEGCHSNFDLTIDIQSPSIIAIENDGSGNINISGNNTMLTNLDITSSGSGNTTANSAMSVTTLQINNSGSGNLNLFDIDSNDATVSVSGSGIVEVTAQDNLDCTISGSGNIFYKGQPTISQNITGSGDVIDAN